MTAQRTIARTLLDVAGRTYASEAGIRLADKPSPLYRLLVLSVLLSTRIKADIAVAAAKELAKVGFTTPRAMVGASWQQRVDALGRAHYVRYDESTATALGDGAQLLLDQYGGDLRRLRDHADGDTDTLAGCCATFPGWVPSGWTSSAVRPSWSGPNYVPTWTARCLPAPRKSGCRRTAAG
jgi:hypothetical protein